MERFTGDVQGCLSASCDWGGVKSSTVWRQGILTAGSLLPLPPLTGSANTAHQLIGNFQTNEKFQISSNYFSPHHLCFSPHCVPTASIWQSPVAMRNVPKYLRHTGVLNIAIEVALSFPSDVEDQPSQLQVSKAM